MVTSHEIDLWIVSQTQAIDLQSVQLLENWPKIHFFSKCFHCCSNLDHNNLLSAEKRENKLSSTKKRGRSKIWKKPQNARPTNSAQNENIGPLSSRSLLEMSKLNSVAWNSLQREEWKRLCVLLWPGHFTRIISISVRGELYDKVQTLFSFNVNNDTMNETLWTLCHLLCF